MSIIDKLLGREIRADTETAAVTPEVDECLLNALLGKTSMTKQRALEIPTIQACVNLIGYTVSSLPIKLYEKDSTGKVTEITDDQRLRMLNDDTFDTLTAPQFWRAMIEDYYLGKGAYAYINTVVDTKEIHHPFGDYAYSDNPLLKEAQKIITQEKFRLKTSIGSVLSINYVDERNISFYQGRHDPIFKDYKILVDGQQHEPEEFLKVLRHTHDGIQSRSIIEDAPTLLNVAYKTLVYEQNLVARGGNKRGFLESEKRLDKNSFQQLKDAFRKLYSSNDENVIVLNDGVKFQEASNTSVEMQLQESKESIGKDICHLFGVPSSLIYGGATQQDMETFIRTIADVLYDIESSLDRDLLRWNEKGHRYFAFDTRELTRGNQKERYEAYAIGLSNHFLQIDEIRQMEDLEPAGFNFITLGLDSVLYDPKSNTIYTPNTNQMAELTGRPMNEQEDRADTKNLIVAGPPGAGKTTLVKEKMNNNDIVIDLDSIKHALNPGIEIHDDAQSMIPVLTSVRDAIYKMIQTRSLPGRAYIITTEADDDVLQNMAKQLNADVEVLDYLSEETVIDRITNDATRPNKERFIQLVHEWYAKRGDKNGNRTEN